MTWGQIDEMARFENLHAMPQASRNHNDISRSEVDVRFRVIREHQSCLAVDEIEYLVPAQVPFASVRCILRHDRNTKDHSINGLVKIVFIGIRAGIQAAVKPYDLIRRINL